MATTTTNFGWDIPQSTDLVKDGATAIAALGQDIDTALVDLKGGTTGQVLAKASNSDLDFTWTADASGIPATIFDAKGDLIAASAADTAARLAVGTNGQYLSANSSTSTGLEWVTPPAAGKIAQVVFGETSTTTSNSTSTFADTNLTATITPTAATSKILVLINQNGIFKSNQNSLNNNEVKLLRGATTLINTMTGGYTNSALANNVGAVSASYLDSPATTSATTYKTQFRCDNGTASVSVQYNASTSTIVLMEVLV